MNKNNITVIIIALLLGGCHNPEPATPTRKIQRVTVTEAGLTAVVQPIHTSGTLSSKTEVKLSFKTGGIIDRITVSEGQPVAKGTLMASLNLAEITAKKQQAEQAWQKAVRDYQRVDNLYRDSVATLEHLQDARTAMDVARSNVDIAEFNYRYSTIEAPVSGKILLKLAEENEVVGAGQPVFLFGSTEGDWVVKASLPDRDIIRVNLGDAAQVYFDAYPGHPFEAVVTQLGKAADPYTGTYEVELTIKSERYELASGFMAKADILPPQADSCLQVPVDAVIEADGQTAYLFVVSGSIVNKREVTIARIARMVCITGGLAPGELVVVEGAPYLNDGDSVAVVSLSRVDSGDISGKNAQSHTK